MKDLKYSLSKYLLYNGPTSQVPRTLYTLLLTSIGGVSKHEQKRANYIQANVILLVCIKNGLNIVRGESPFNLLVILFNTK